MMDIRKFKKEHKTFIAVGTVVLIAGAVALVWNLVKKCCCGQCGIGADEEE